MRYIVLVVLLGCALDAYGQGQTIVVGTASGLGQVRQIDLSQLAGTGEVPSDALLADFAPYDPANVNGATVAGGDLNGDGRADIITGAGPGTLAATMAFDANSQVKLANFFPFAADYTGGVNVAAGDINGDSKGDIIVGASSGLAHVRVINADGVSDTLPSGVISPSALLGDFFAFTTGYTGGISVASGDVNGDPFDDVIVGASNGLAHVRVIDGTRLAETEATGEISASAQLANFFAFSTGYTGGVNVAMGDVNNDGTDDVVVGARTGLAQVRVIDGTMLDQVTPGGEIDPSALLADFFAFNTSFMGGINVAAGDVTGDGRDDIILGAATGLAHVRVIDANQIGSISGEVMPAQLFANFFAFDLSFTGGVNVAAGAPIPEPATSALLILGMVAGLGYRRRL